MNLSQSLKWDLTEIQVESIYVKENCAIIGKNRSDKFIWNEVEQKHNHLGWIETETPGWLSFELFLVKNTVKKTHNIVKIQYYY